MTPEAQRIAIAKACGWRLWSSFNGLWAPPNCVVEYDTDAYPLPDYLNDLNAMHEAEKALGEKHVRSYAFTLSRVLDTAPTVDLDDQFLNIHATAAQRAEAFLQTLNLWTDEQ
jgi:hypothetical protein